MRTVEFTGRADRPVGDQVAEMQRWLDDKGIRVTDLKSRVLHARVMFTATFDQAADAAQFLKEFNEEAA